MAAHIARHLDDPTGAAALYDVLLPYQTVFAFAAGTPTGCTNQYLALLAATMGRYDEAEERFASVTKLYDRIGAQGWLARTRLEWATMLRARAAVGDGERAHELLGQALLTARELGLAKIEHEAVELLSSR